MPLLQNCRHQLFRMKGDKRLGSPEKSSCACSASHAPAAPRPTPPVRAEAIASFSFLTQTGKRSHEVLLRQCISHQTITGELFIPILHFSMKPGDYVFRGRSGHSKVPVGGTVPEAEP